MTTEHKGCACRWDAEDNRVATCVRHQGWLDVVQEWADRARDAEAKVVELVEKLGYANQVIDQRNAELSCGRADFMQALTDPENQPSQWGTVTLSAYQALEVQIREMRMAFKELRRVIEGNFYSGSPPKRSLQSHALRIINNALGDGHD